MSGPRSCTFKKLLTYVTREETNQLEHVGREDGISITIPGHSRRTSRCSAPFSVQVALVLTGLWYPSLPPNRDYQGDVDVIANAKTDDGDDAESSSLLTGSSVLSRDRMKRWANNESECDTGENNSVVDGKIKDEEDNDKDNDVDFITEAERWSPHELPSVRATRHLRSASCDFIFTALLLLLSLWNVGHVLIDFYAMMKAPQLTLAVLGFQCFVLQFASIFLVSLVMRLRLFLNACRQHSPEDRRLSNCTLASLFDAERIRESARYILDNTHGHRQIHGRWCCLLFCAFPLFCVIVKVVNRVFVSPPECQLFLHFFTRIIIALHTFCYCSFWYIIYVQKVALHHRLNETILRIRRAAIKDDVDQARQLTVRIYSEYNVIHKFTGTWTAAMMMALTMYVMYNLVHTYELTRQLFVQLDAGPGAAFRVFFEAVEDWSIIILMYVVPIAALGGANLEYMWQSFRHVITRSKVEVHRAFWDALDGYVVKIDIPRQPQLKWTLLLPILGLFLPFLLGISTFDFDEWNYRFPYHACSPKIINETMIIL